MVGDTVEAIEVFKGVLRDMLDKARTTKHADTIQSALTKSDFADLFQRIDSSECFVKSTETKRSSRYAVIETAVRDTFNILLASSVINKPEFMQIWNLLDIVSILSDDEYCDPGLLFWLIEELLDSQTIAGCRRIFDYLESRRERITAKHFKHKTLAILRACNELLRRLSRAEDTAFCGRVFIFLFQSFPLGDKSSVNLRGEYHVENVTTYDDLPQKIEEKSEPMEVDTDVEIQHIATAESKAIPTGPASSVKVPDDFKTGPKSVTFDAKEFASVEKPLDPDTLYPIFWSLQQSFSQPKKLFDPDQFSAFKKGLEATIVMFKSVQNEQNSRNSTKSEECKRGTKRKRGLNDDDLTFGFNPKYLTSRDLFELEISDLSFRRHILVQALIIMDFLLSLSIKAKEKLTSIQQQNKSVVYHDHVLSEDDTKWAIETKKSIAEYLKQGLEGPYFHRMVETVLCRDKNWVRWKIESCPSIERPAVTSAEHNSAKSAARKATTNKKLRAKPLGSLDLSFLTEADGIGGMEKLKDASRHQLPTLDSFRNKIALDEMEIEMPTSEETKEAAINSKASKSWRALRIASKTKLVAFDKIEDPEKIDVIFQEPVQPESMKENGIDSIDASGAPFSTDRRAIIISGPPGVGKDSLVDMLVNRHPKTFTRIILHTARMPREGEVGGVDYYFVSKDQFNIMRDGDQFLEHNCNNGDDYGTSYKSIEGVVASGRIPVMEMDHNAVQQVKDQSYSARFIFLATPTIKVLEQQLRLQDGNSEDMIRAELQLGKEAIVMPETLGFYEKVFTHEDLAKTYDELERCVFHTSDPERSTRESQGSDNPSMEVGDVGFNERSS